mgnify:CR=1 FL=1
MVPEPPFVDTGYDEAARIYDLEYPDCKGAELDFLASIVGNRPAHVLELGTGTGRVAFALACLGHYVTGIDISVGMLARARAKQMHIPSAVATRVTFKHANIADFQLGSQFDVVVAAFNVILLLPDATSRSHCLTTSLGHLNPGGFLVMDAFAANALDRTPDHEMVEFLESAPSCGHRTTRERFYTYDPNSDRGQSRLIYRLYDTEGNLAEDLQLGYSLALMTHDQIAHEIREAGFVDLQTYGDYHRSPWTSESPRLVVCARHPQR